ncbi:purine-cytosine permease-like transporter [Marinomonas sp. CT5]|nr:purine-cytosine permease-like transporter [Marinomonas sp. CT5]
MATTLVALFVGALATFIAGIEISFYSGLFVCLVSGSLGWGMGHIAYKTGLSSSVLARMYGFGEKGSSILALVFGFMIIGFIALENVMIYKTLLFWINMEDNLLNSAITYGVLTLLWVMFAAFGFKLISKVSSIAVTVFIFVLVFILYDVIQVSNMSSEELVGFTSQLSIEALSAMNIDSDFSKFAFCVNVLIGFAGAAALINADLGRYAKSSTGTGVSAFLGAFCLNVLMLIIGGVLMHAGSEEIVQYHIGQGMSLEAARAEVLKSPESVAGAFIIFGGSLGGLLMIMAQGKIQIINAYSASLSLTSFFDSVFGWKPGRMFFLVVANVLACFMIYINILHFFESFMTILGVLTTCFSMIIMIDYFLVRKWRDGKPLNNKVNWPAMISIIFSFIMAHYVFVDYVPIEFFTSSISVFVSYPIFYKLMVK